MVKKKNPLKRALVYIALILLTTRDLVSVDLDAVIFAEA